MREIKLRAFDTKSNCWRYWTVLEDCMCDLVVYGSIDKDTLGEWIGKKDINGTDIYEGDTIQGDLFDSRLPIMGEIVFDDHFSFYANKNEAGNTPLYKINKIEIIGNIHEGG